jgi:hypothetical protein
LFISSGGGVFAAESHFCGWKELKMLTINTNAEWKQVLLCKVLQWMNEKLNGLHK